MGAYLYPISLPGISVFVFALERFFPWRPEQKQLRPKLWSDFIHLVFFGFRWEALMFHAIFGTLIGHLNHSNLNLGHGPWRYVLNSPRMHIWHHDYDGTAKTTVNYGIIFSCWDWIFGTAKMPADPPAHLGFDGVETFPDNFFSQEIWPIPKLLPRIHSTAVT